MHVFSTILIVISLPFTSSDQVSPALIQAANGDQYYGFGTAIALSPKWFMTLSGSGDDVDCVSYVIHIQERSIALRNVEQFSLDGAFSAFAITDSMAVVATTQHGRGMVHVLRHLNRNWIQDTVLTNPNSENNARFGCSMVIHNQQIIIADPDETGGAVYVFDASAPKIRLRQKMVLEAPTPEPADFGAVIAVSQDFLAIGAPRKDRSSATIEIYQQDDEDWVFFQRLIPAEEPMLRYPQATWGWGIHLDGDLLVLTSLPDPSEDAPCMLAIYRRDGDRFDFEGFVTGPATSRHSRFGWELTSHNADILVGDPKGPNSQDVLSGVVYRYSKVDGVWQQTGVIDPPDAEHAQAFGVAVALDEEHLFIGSPMLPGEHDVQGGIYVFPMKNFGQSGLEVD